MGLFSNALVNVIDTLPERVIWQFAKRYIAGADLTSGLRVRAEIYRSGMLNTMDVLGEDTNRIEQAEHAYLQYCDLIGGMAESGIPGNVSLKLTQLGLKIDPGFTRLKVFDLARRANEQGFFFRFDMEDSSTTDQTLELFRDLRKEIPSSGIVLQAYLKRTESDLLRLLEDGFVNIRICKGIYKEHSGIAFQDRDSVRSNFMRLVNIMFDSGAYPAIATHDHLLIKSAMQEIHARKLPPEKYEFQMLHGVGFKWRSDLLKEGCRLRIYIPYGESWRAYSFRRFRENPVLAFYVMKNLVNLRGS